MLYLLAFEVGVRSQKTKKEEEEVSMKSERRGGEDSFHFGRDGPWQSNGAMK